MASVWELANLSAMAYHWSKNRFQGWSRIRPYGNRSGKGFYAESYQNKSKKEIVLAIRGTDLEKRDLSDFVADGEIVLRFIPHQFKAAKSAYETEKKRADDLDCNLILTGHSLGGALAALLAAQEGSIKPAVVTFNSPGMKQTYIENFGNIIGAIAKYNYRNYFDVSRFLHIRAIRDTISSMPVFTGPHIGEIKLVYVNAWGDGSLQSRIEAQHSIDNLVKSLRTRPRYHKDLHYGIEPVTPKMMSE
jgi:pimeloyl-ACP methyl ester carboxylesterase